MFRKYCLIFLLNILGISGNYIPHSYTKRGNNYNKLIQLPEEKSNTSQGYVEIANRTLLEYKNGKVSADALNKFSIALEEYFTLKVYEKDDINVIEQPYDLINASDPISLPDAKLEGILFYKAEAFGHPLYKHNIDPTYDGLTSPYKYSVNAKTKSDVIIFTGYFNIKRTPYYFVYKLKGATYEASVRIIRGYKKPVFIKINLDFVKENLIHTYDSAYENYTQTNELIHKKLITAVEQIYLPYLDKYNYKESGIKMATKDLQYISLYRKLVISVLTESAIGYLKGKGLASFNIKPLNFTNPVGYKVFVQTYANIKVHGILNFTQSELGNSTMKLDERKGYNIFEEINFFYTLDDEDSAFIEFMIGDGRQVVSKKFKINSIKIIASYSASANEKPAKVRRNKEIFLNNSGFLIKFDVENYNPIYEFLFRHVSNDISRAIENVLVADGA